MFDTPCPSYPARFANVDYVKLGRQIMDGVQQQIANERRTMFQTSSSVPNMMNINTPAVSSNVRNERRPEMSSTSVVPTPGLVSNPSPGSGLHSQPSYFELARYGAK